MHIIKLMSDFDNLLNYSKIIILLEDSTLPEIEFRFKNKHFKHLLGFHYTRFRTTSSKELYKKCKQGKFQLQDDEKLMNFNSKKNKFKQEKGPGVNKLINKIKNFKMIHSILCSSNKSPLVDFEKTLVINGETNQGSEYILHLEKDNIRFHLGLIYDENIDLFVPASFFFEEGEKKDKFIEGQKQIKIKKISRIK